MSAPAWMPLYIAEYLADTGHLSTVEHGAYMLLIMHYWQNKRLPTDEHKLARICRMSIAEWSAVRDTIADFFDGDWKHERIETELRIACETMSKRSAAGRAAAYARHNKRSASALPIAVQSNAPAGLGLGTLEDIPSEEGGASTRAVELDRLENQLREAAGLQNSISTGLFDLSPIVKLLDAGYSLESDILPKLRAAAATGKTPSTWAYFVPAIIDGKTKTIPPKANGATPAEDVTWIDEDDPRFGDYAARSLTELGRPLIPGSSRYAPGFGAFIPKAWTLPPETRAEVT